MANKHYFGDDALDFGFEPADVRNPARRQFMFSLAIGALLLASAAMIGAHPRGPDGPPVARHQIKPAAPAPAVDIALPGPYSPPQG